ncbi:MAG: hypothetical protein AB7P76_10060 [Candidatus Melainabacteria bacterium]
MLRVPLSFGMAFLGKPGEIDYYATQVDAEAAGNAWAASEDAPPGSGDRLLWLPVERNSGEKRWAVATNTHPDGRRNDLMLDVLADARGSGMKPPYKGMLGFTHLSKKTGPSKPERTFLRRARDPEGDSNNPAVQALFTNPEYIPPLNPPVTRGSRVRRSG